MQQEVVLAMLAKEPSHGYELRARLRQALGPLGEAMNPGHVYVTLARLETAGLVTAERSPGLADRPDRKVYELAPAGQQRVAEWLAEVAWPKPDLFESLHEAGQTLVIVTHDARIAATADRLISMRDGAFVDETQLTGGTSGQLGALAGLEG